MENIKYRNFEAIKLENEKLRLILLPDLGFKIASIYNKNKDFEYLFQPVKDYRMAEYGDDFSKYDTSGIDDCIPTIDACKYPNKDIDLVDHGDSWSSSWALSDTGEDYAEAWLSLESLGLKFTRKVRLKPSSIDISYRLVNDKDEDLAYLWAFHDLCNYDEDTVLSFEEGLNNYVNVMDDQAWDFDIRKIKNFPENSSFKYYFTDEIKEGWAEINHTDSRTKYRLSFNPEEIPYMGVWLTTGGFKGEKNIAIEPCNGFYDSLEKAYELGKYQVIEKNSEKNWTMKIEIIDY